MSEDGSTARCPCTCGGIGCASRRGQRLATHGTEYRYDVGCRCDECKAAKSRSAAARHKRVNDAAMADASKRGQQWTGVELEQAIRQDLTIREIASLLKRTPAGVLAARHRALTEPKWMAVVGSDCVVPRGRASDG